MAAKKKSKAASKAGSSTAAKKKAKKSAKARTPKVARAPAKAKTRKSAKKPAKANERRNGNATAVLHALVRVLAERKLVDPDTYAGPLGDLLEEAGHARAAAVSIAKAKTLRKQLTLTVPTSASGNAAESALVAFAEDAHRVIERSELLIGLLRGMRKPTNQLFTLAQLAKKLYSDNQRAFETHWSEAIGERQLPPGIGALRINGKFLLFFLNDIVQSPPDEARDEPPVTVVSEPPPPGAPVRDRLLEAFDELDVAGGRRNYVTLFDLRRRLPDVGRDGFDAAVKELRRAWILTLDPAEGRHERLPEEVLAAGIMDQSSLMVYAARRDA